MLLLYGLGNIDRQYWRTKHNVGRLVVEHLAAKYAAVWQKHPSYTYAKTQLLGQSVYFLLSNGFMNTSGQPLVDFVRYFKLNWQLHNGYLIILQDDSDQVTGAIKLTLAGGSGGHKGVQSIYDHSRSINWPLERIWRLKIGIRPALNRARSETFVLSQITPDEIRFLATLADRLYQLMPLLAAGNFQQVQTVLNRKSKKE